MSEIDNTVEQESCKPQAAEKPQISIVLASASPRRRELLSAAGLKFTVRVSEVDETLTEELEAHPDQAVQVLAERKAGVVVQEILAEHPQGAIVVIGSDTMVVLDDVIFGKPKSMSNATFMLRQLSGRTHQVMTGVSIWMINAIYPDSVSVGKKTFVDISDVTFKELSDVAIALYLQKGESYDKAGAYAAQGAGAELIDHIDGDIDTVIGLPVERILREFPELRPE